MRFEQLSNTRVLRRALQQLFRQAVNVVLRQRRCHPSLAFVAAETARKFCQLGGYSQRVITYATRKKKLA